MRLERERREQEESSGWWSEMNLCVESFKTAEVETSGVVLCYDKYRREE